MGAADGMRPPPDDQRVPIYIHPDVRKRLHSLLMHHPEMRAVGYSAFINRACEVTEGAIMEQRRERARFDDETKDYR